MQGNLKGHTILVGREPIKGRLLVSININGQPKSAAIGLNGSVPTTVSKCIATQGIAHFKLDISQSGGITITNLKPQNVTYVNGSEIVKKVIHEDSKVTLGRDNFPINLGEVLETASKIINVVAPPPPKEYSILPLKRISEVYHDKSIELKKKPQKLALLQRLSSFFTIAGGSLYMALGRFGLKIGGPNVEYFFGALTIIGVILFVYSLIKSANNHSVDDTEVLKKWYQKKYVCPNPDCKHYLGGQGEYELLRQNKNCPYCKCKWTEK